MWNVLVLGFDERPTLEMKIGVVVMYEALPDFIASSRCTDSIPTLRCTTVPLTHLVQWVQTTCNAMRHILVKSTPCR